MKAEKVRAYAEIAGDYNALHFDAAFTATIRQASPDAGRQASASD